MANNALLTESDFGHEVRETFLLATLNEDYVGATLHLPKTPPASEIKQVVLWLPGWSGPRTGPAELLIFLAKHLAKSGVISLRMDFHGRGDASGAFGDCDLDRMITEASVGWDRLKTRFPNAAIGVGGICSGSNVALGLASLRPTEIPFAVALSLLPYQPARTEDYERRRRWKNFKQYASKALKPSTWARVFRGEIDLERVKKNVTASEKSQKEGKRNLKDSARDIEAELLAWKGRALFVWGEGDEEAPLARKHFEELHQKGCAANAVFHTISGANHNFYGQGWRDELAGRITTFFREPFLASPHA